MILLCEKGVNLPFDISGIRHFTYELEDGGYEDLSNSLEMLLRSDVAFAERSQVENLKLPDGYEHLSRFFPAFLNDYPDIKRNVFLMMRFKTGAQYDEIYHSIKDGLKPFGLSLLRADNKDYTGDLWENVCLYMLGSNYGIAVFEEVDIRQYNPNVALEIGYMKALNKRCLILKDQRMPNMPTDIVGKLYKEFDTYRIAESIKVAIHSWVFDIGLV